MSAGNPDRSMYPVTVKQLKKCTTTNGTEYIIDQRTLFRVIVVGFIITIEEGIDGREILFEDSTGLVTLYAYGDISQVAELNEFSYTRFVLKPSPRGDTIRWVIESAVPLLDYNELYSHHLVAYAAHLRSIKGPIKRIDAQQQQQQQQQYGSLGNSAFSANTHQNGPTEDKYVSALAQLRDQHPPYQSGVPIDKLANYLHVTIDNARQRLSQLLEEGLVYSTTDDSTFLPV